MRIRSVLELPQRLRAQFISGPEPPTTPSAAQQLRKATLEAERERLVLWLLLELEALNLRPLFVREYKFHPERQWRLDLFAPWYRLGVELHGGVYSGGRHVRPQGFERDREKMNAAVELDIRVLEYTTQQVIDGTAMTQIERVIEKTHQRRDWEEVSDRLD